MASVFVCHKVSAHHQFVNDTYFTTSALVLKFSAFFIIIFVKLNSNVVRTPIWRFFLRESTGLEKYFVNSIYTYAKWKKFDFTKILPKNRGDKIPL